MKHVPWLIKLNSSTQVSGSKSLKLALNIFHGIFFIHVRIKLLFAFSYTVAFNQNFNEQLNSISMHT